MSEVKEIKPFRQIPSCDAEAKLTITGLELQSITNVINIFRESVTALDSVINRNINEGGIVIKYVTQDGSEISKEEATEYLRKASEFLKKNQDIVLETQSKNEVEVENEKPLN